MIDCVAAEKREEDVRGDEEIDRSEIVDARERHEDCVPLHKRAAAVHLFMSEGIYSFSEINTEEGAFLLVPEKIMKLFDIFRASLDLSNIVLVDDSFLYFLSHFYPHKIPDINVLCDTVWSLEASVIHRFINWKDDMKATMN